MSDSRNPYIAKNGEPELKKSVVAFVDILGYQSLIRSAHENGDARAGLIMAMTAWETYVEDRVLECTNTRLAALSDSSVAQFVKAKLDEEIKRLHNPNSDKTIQLFKDYAGVDLAEKWKWNNFDTKTVREKLNQYIKLRGDVVSSVSSWRYKQLNSARSYKR